MFPSACPCVRDIRILLALACPHPTSGGDSPHVSVLSHGNATQMEKAKSNPVETHTLRTPNFPPISLLHLFSLCFQCSFIVWPNRRELQVFLIFVLFAIYGCQVHELCARRRHPTNCLDANRVKQNEVTHAQKLASLRMWRAPSAIICNEVRALHSLLISHAKRPSGGYYAGRTGALGLLATHA